MRNFDRFSCGKPIQRHPGQHACRSTVAAHHSAGRVQSLRRCVHAASLCTNCCSYKRQASGLWFLPQRVLWGLCTEVGWALPRCLPLAHCETVEAFTSMAAASTSFKQNTAGCDAFLGQSLTGLCTSAARRASGELQNKAKKQLYVRQLLKYVHD